VARLTALLCHVTVDSPGVRVGVTVATAGRGEAEPECRWAPGAPPVPPHIDPSGEPRASELAVTRIAGDRQVTSLEGKSGPAVIGDIEVGRTEAEDVVAGLAGAPVAPIGELTPVGIDVTPRAAVEGATVGPTCRVACLARHVLMQPRQGVASEVMIEAAAGSAAPSGGGVAGLAGGSQTPLVNVLMTGGASLRDRGVECGCRPGCASRSMASLAGGWPVTPGEGIPRFGMVETRCRAPGLVTVTPVAGSLGKLSPVRIGVAGGAGGVEPQIRAIRVEAFGLQPCGLAIALAMMAVVAPELAVAAREGPAGHAVVEAAAPLRAPEHELELLALVLHVAGATVPVVRACVQPGTGGDPVVQNAVADEALLRVDLLLPGVAAQAARAPLQIRVSPTQWAG